MFHGPLQVLGAGPGSLLARRQLVSPRNRNMKDTQIRPRAQDEAAPGLFMPHWAHSWVHGGHFLCIYGINHSVLVPAWSPPRPHGTETEQGVSVIRTWDTDPAGCRLPSTQKAAVASDTHCLGIISLGQTCPAAHTGWARVALRDSHTPTG